MLTRIQTSTLTGIDAVSVEVEVEVREGRANFSIIGLADSAVRESRERVLSALKHSGFMLPKHVLVNLAPAELKKEGAAFDLPIAIGILSSSGQLQMPNSKAMLFHGELSLDGALKPVRGALAFAAEARQRRIAEMFLPQHNAAEAALISGISVRGAASLREVVRHFLGQKLACAEPMPRQHAAAHGKLMAEVWGQESAKRAMLIAAAGGHNLIMIGPPGCGKSMLAERFPSILPPLSETELLGAVRVHSVAGLDTGGMLSGQRPFRSPHHGISDAGLIGGGSNPRPGEISLAHHGVLFLDEFPEFRRSALEALRSPLESGVVQVSRAKGSLSLPAQFQLLAAMNPCPCGRLGSAGVPCSCSRPAILGYLRKLSQPILDRIDLHIELTPVALMNIKSRGSDELRQLEDEMRGRVLRTRAVQHQRQGRVNALLSSQAVSTSIAHSQQARSLLEQACEKRGLSARGYVRILRVARTIADLESSAEVQPQHIAEALSYRSLERIERYCAAA